MYRPVVEFIFKLVLSTSGGWGPSAMVAFKRLAGLISQKYDQPYSSTLSFIRCMIAFSLIDSAIAYFRGPRSAFHAPARDFNLTDNPLDLIHAEVHLQASTPAPISICKLDINRTLKFYLVIVVFPTFPPSALSFCTEYIYIYIYIKKKN